MAAKPKATVRLTHNGRIFEVGDELEDVADDVVTALIERGEAKRGRVDAPAAPAGPDSA